MTGALFVVLVAGMAVLVFHGLRRARAGSGVMVAVGVIYLVVPGVLAWRGLLDRYDPLPAPALVMVLLLTVITLTITLSSLGKRLIDNAGLAALVGFQAFRIPVEWLLHRLYQEGVIPVQMTYAAATSTSSLGLTAAAIGVWLARGRPIARHRARVEHSRPRAPREHRHDRDIVHAGAVPRSSWTAHPTCSRA